MTWTDCDEAEDYAVPNVLSPRDLVFRPDIMDENCNIIIIIKSIPHELPSAHWLKATGQCVLERCPSATIAGG